MPFDKTITPNYEIDGRRKRLTGFVGQIADEGGVVLHSWEYNSYGEAETALNAVVYDLLMDYAERGLVDTVPVCDPPAEPCPLGGDEGDTLPGYGAPVLRHSGLPNPLYRVQMAELDPPAEPCPLGSDEGDTLPLLADTYAVISRCLDNAALPGALAELRRVHARLEQALCVEQMMTA